MAKTPADIDVRQHAGNHRYYDGNRYVDDAALDAAYNRGQCYWWICYFNDAEEDVVAPNKAEASAVMRAALARDFDPGCKLEKVVLA